MSDFSKINNSVRFPTSIIVRGEDLLGVELAKSILEQGGFVIMIDNGIQSVEKYLPLIDAYSDNLVFLDYTGLIDLKKDLRRLDYVFYLNHQVTDLTQKISTQELLQSSNYLDSVLDLTAKFDAKFLLTTSIKAHQMIIADKIIDINYDVDAEARYAIYSELEIQRYSESLVKEYQEKVGINARVIRLATLLGKGMEINLESGLVSLVLAGLQGRNLVLNGDGLETDYYIHYLDAAYGIIKAQFTPNTKGQIYTLANEEEVPMLSLAYKIMEYVPTAKEIRFDEGSNVLPPLKLYKPAPNLIVIGWRPRVTLDRALQQTINYLQTRLAEVGGDPAALNNELIPINPVVLPKEKSFKEKALEFFFIAEDKTVESQAVINARAQTAAEVNTQGALGRLIAERRNQEKQRRGNIILANNQLRAKIQPRLERNFLEKFEGAISRSLWSFKQRFEFLKNMTVLDFVFMVIGFIFFLFVYFQVLAPGLNLTKNLLITYNNLQTAVKQENPENLSQISSTIAESQDDLAKLEFIFDFIGKKDTYKSWQILLTNTHLYLGNLERINTALSPWRGFTTQFEPGFVERLDGRTYLSVDSSKNYADYFNQMYSARSEFTTSLSANKELLPEIKTGIASLPFELETKINTEFEKLFAVDAELEVLAEIYTNIPLLSGKDSTKHYFVVLQDEQRYTPGGGELVGLLHFEVANGSIINVSAKNLAEYYQAAPNFNERALEELKLSAEKIITSSNARFQDIALISDQKVLMQNLKAFLAGIEKVEPDLLIMVNSNTVKELIGEAGLPFQRETINSVNYSGLIEKSLAGNATVSGRNEVLLGLLAKVFEGRLNDLDGFAEQINPALSNAISGNELRFYTNNLSFNKMLAQLIPDKAGDNFISLGLSYDNKNISLQDEPVLTLSGKLNYAVDLSSKADIVLGVSGGESLGYVTACLPVSAKEIEYPDFNEELVSLILSYPNQKACQLYLKSTDLKFPLSYKLGKVDGNELIKLELIATPGIETQFDLEFSFSDLPTEVVPVTEGFTRQGEKFLYRGTMRGNKLFIFKTN